MFEGRILPLHQYILEQAKLSGTNFNYLFYTVSYKSSLRWCASLYGASNGCAKCLSIAVFSKASLYYSNNSQAFIFLRLTQ